MIKPNINSFHRYIHTHSTIVWTDTHRTGGTKNNYVIYDKENNIQSKTYGDALLAAMKERFNGNEDSAQHLMTVMNGQHDKNKGKANQNLGQDFIPADKGIKVMIDNTLQGNINDRAILQQTIPRATANGARITITTSKNDVLQAHVSQYNDYNDVQDAVIYNGNDKSTGISSLDKHHDNEYVEHYDHYYNYSDGVLYFVSGVVITIIICCFAMVISIMIGFCAFTTSKWYIMDNNQQFKQNKSRYNMVDDNESQM